MYNLRLIRTYFDILNLSDVVPNFKVYSAPAWEEGGISCYVPSHEGEMAETRTLE